MTSKSAERPGTELAALTPTDLAAIPARRVAIAGDWHGNVRWLQQIVPRIHRMAPDVKTILHLGDLGIYTMGDRPGHGFLTAAIPYWLKKTSIDRILATPGNHEQWSLLSSAFAAHRGGWARDGRRLYSLGMDGQFGNVAILDLRDLSVDFLEDVLPLDDKDPQ